MDQDLNIIESWEDDTGQRYAIVRLDEQDQQRYGCKAYEPMWVSDGDDELWSFGGSVGYTTPTFETVEEARDFLLAGIDQQQDNPEIWLEMVAV